MELEPLPKVTFLPAQLTELVIRNWTGDIIDFEKNGQICKVYHGQGTCEFREGHTFKGELKYGLLHGRGEFIWTDGTKYKGEFRDNEITGNGRYDWPDQSYYEGQVFNGLRHGKGTYTNPKEGVIYEGEWKNGLRHGYGILKYRNGSIYEGSWERGMKWGQGKMTYATGNYYEGDWKNNKRNGEGTMNWLTSNEKYQGNWEENYQSGFGTHVWLEGSGENKLLRNRYVGYWKLGLRNGNGTFYYSNGSKYEGEWKDNLKNGQGVFTFEDGTCYQGPFENDRMINRAVQGVTAVQSQQNQQEDQQQLITDTNTQNGQQQSQKTGQKGTNNTNNNAQKGQTPSAAPAQQDASPSKTNKAPLGGGKAQATGAGLNQTTGAAPGTTQGGQTQGTKFVATNRAKKEVEQNPFKTLIDISDLIEFESNPQDVQKEVQNILLRHNSEMKTWYKYFAKKIEAQKSEESFAMTLRQIWRFLRDCQVIGPEATIAQFDRIYFQGTKNHYTLLGQKDKQKFSSGQAQQKGGLLEKGDQKQSTQEQKLIGGGVADGEQKLLNIDDSIINKVDGGDEESVDEEEEEEAESLNKIFNAEAEDIHQASKVVLQRQFFEAIARSAAVKYANRSDIPTLADKLEFLFKNKLIPLATKNKSKSAEEDKQFKIAESVFVDYEDQLLNVFKFFSKKGKSSSFGIEDVTLEVDDIINLFKKTELLDGTNLQLADLIGAIEKYYSPETKLQAKLQPEQFQAFIKNNPNFLKSQQQSRKHSEQHHQEEDEETKKQREEEEMKLAYQKWKKQVISQHLVFVRGVEIVFFEFKEILLVIAMKLREIVDPKTGKSRVVLTKFIEDFLLKKLNPYLKFNIQAGKGGSSAARVWPESQKDKEIKVKMEEKRKKEEEERKILMEKKRQEAELARMKEEDHPALDWKEVEELRRKIIEEEEAKRRAAEAEEEDEEEEEEGDEEDGQGDGGDDDEY